MPLDATVSSFMTVPSKAESLAFTRWTGGAACTSRAAKACAAANTAAQESKEKRTAAINGGASGI
jgi:hypothetical protein